MGASELDTSQLNKVVKIEMWAAESVTLHKRECIEKYCGGKSKIWWTVRHPQISEMVATPTAKSFAIEKYHCCGLILDRLENGVISWLPKERRIYAARSDEEIMELLGRIPETRENKSESLDDINNPFPGAVPPKWMTKREQPRELRRDTPDETWRNGRRVDDKRPMGFSGTVDALTRKG